MNVSVIIPVYNEVDTVMTVLERVQAAQIPLKEIILVDDCSQDGTPDILKKLDSPLIKVFYHEVNQGKGAALRTGFAQATGDIVAIQDADLEYNPAELPKLILPILEGHADVVFGSRFIGSELHRVVYYWHMLGNRFLTMLSNMLTNLNLTDMECCYKIFKKEILDKIQLEENRFGIEPELTAKVSRLNCCIFEGSVSYYGRTYAEGKKITWKDGVRAIYAILKYNLFRR